MAGKSTVICVACGVFVLAVTVLSITLIATSLRRLASDEVGIAYNIHQRSLSKQVQNTGLHNGAPGFKFIKFPSTFKSLSFSNDECLNHEGVAILLTIEFQHRARPKQLREIIMGFRDQDNYVKMLKFLAKASMHDACSLFNTSQFQIQRSQFQDLVYTLMSKRLDTVSAEITDLQVSNIERPKSYETVVRNKESAKENIKIAKNERPRQLIEAKSLREEAVTQAQITVEQAKSGGRIILSKADAEAASIMAAYEAEAEAYANIMTSQKLSVDGLLSYLGVRAIAETNNTVNVGLPAPAKTTYTYDPKKP